MSETEADNGTKSHHEAEHDGSLVESYRADGMLYAYRDDDEHVIVSNGRDAGDKWTQRVSAERTHVAIGEQLWSIPDNWEQTYRIDGGENRAWHVYHIPETDIEVKVSVPINNHLVDAWYRVLTVGESVVEYAGELDRDAARRTLEQANESGEYDDLVIEGLRALVEKNYRWNPFVRAFEESINEFGPEALNDSRSLDAPLVSADGTDPWGDHYVIDDLVYDAIGASVDKDWDVVRDIEQLLQERAIPVYPAVTVSIDTSGVVADYHIRALVQAGCSPAEAIDRYYVEQSDLTQTEWAAERGCDQSTVSGNIKQAKRTLKA